MTIIVKEKLPEIKTKETSLRSYWLTLNEMRLDASFYAEEGRRAVRLLKESGYEITNISALAKSIFNPPPIKRQYSGVEGTPYLMPTELFLLRLKPTKFVFANKMKNIEDWFVREGGIILTQSGNAGIPLYITKSLEKFVVSQNAIRIVLRKGSYSGFLYAYLSTWVGQALVTRDQFGVTVEHIRPHHVSQVHIPLFPEKIQKQVHQNIVKVFQLREKARKLLKQAERMLFQELYLTPIKSSPKETKTFSVDVSKLNLRLDASYHDPDVIYLQNALQKGKHFVDRLGNVTKSVFIPNRFKRVYVEKEYGVPFLSGKNIAQIKPYDLKYISKKVTKELEKCRVYPRWILITRSGTVGRVALVPSNWNGWTISEHAMRIVPNEKKAHAGFLAIFLMSEFGYPQVISKIYGGIVDELAEDDLRDVLVPLPSLSVQEKIGKLVVEAYELKELANKIEDETVETLENMLSTHKKLDVNKEYLKEINAYTDSFELISNEEFRESREEFKLGETTSFDEFRKEHDF